MPIAVMCPGCDSRLNAPDAAAGKTVKCPKCKEPMVIPDPAEEAAAGFETVEDDDKPVAKKKAIIDDDDDDKPVAKKKRVVVEEDDDAEEDDKPRKKKGKKKPANAGLSPVLIGSIVGGVLLLGGGAFATYWFGIREKPKETASNNSSTTPTTGPNYPGGPGGGGTTPPPPGGGINIPGNNPAPPPPPVPGGNTTTSAPPSGPVTPLYEATNPQIATYRQISNNNLKQIGLAMHNSASVYGDAFPAGVYDTTGNIGLSWRVAILPFIEQDSLYKQFKLNEPWNSEHNRKLIPLMPKTYAAPGQDSKSGRTYYRSFTGADTVFPTPPRGAAGKHAVGLKISGIPDGTSNTGIVIEAGDSVEWTKPDELVYSASGPLPRIGGIFADGVHVLFGDASTRRLKAGISEATLRGLITAKGSEIVDFEK